MNRPNHHRSHLIAAGVLAALAACSGEAVQQTGSPNLYTVVREDLPLTVKENAELEAIRETIVRSEVEGQATILFLEEEGKFVKKGDKLVELDVSELVEKRASQEISVEKAKNAWEQARTAEGILEKELTTKRNQAVSQLRIAEMELEKFLGAPSTAKSAGKNADMVRRLRELILGEVEDGGVANAIPAATEAPRAEPKEASATVDSTRYAPLIDKVTELLRVWDIGDPTKEIGDPLDREMGEMANKVLQQADQIRLAMADLKIKESTASYSQKLYDKQFITRNEFERDDLAYQSQESKVLIAWKDLELLISYTLAKDRIKLEQDFENAKLELERVEASNDAERKKSEFDVSAKYKEYTVAKERLENLLRQVDNAICYAPTPGVVVYARVNRDRRGGEAVAEGVQVRERQNIIQLPDNTKMRCIVKVQEAQVDRVAIGQPAHITVEAFPNEIFTGQVTRVAPVADSGSSWGGNDKKVYTTIVDLNEENADGRLRSRMAAAVTITIGIVRNTLTVPQQAVRRDRSVNYIWKQSPQGPIAVAVKVGSHNQEKVEIIEGVVEGDVVFRTPPRDQPEPRFDQPELPAGADIPTLENGQTTPAPRATAPDEPKGDTAEGQANGGRRGAGRTAKKFVEMSPEELEEYKSSTLDRFAGMAARIEDTEAATKFTTTLDDIRKALAANDLDTAQSHADSLRNSMRALMGGGGRRPGGANTPGRDG